AQAWSAFRKIPSGLARTLVSSVPERSFVADVAFRGGRHPPDFVSSFRSRSMSNGLRTLAIIAALATPSLALAENCPPGSMPQGSGCVNQPATGSTAGTVSATTSPATASTAAPPAAAGTTTPSATASTTTPPAAASSTTTPATASTAAPPAAAGATTPSATASTTAPPAAASSTTTPS